MPRLLLLLTISLLTLSAYSFKPSARVHHYSVEDGLSQGVVMSISQDSRDYMWFATWNGLCRFDGYEFNVYNARPGDGCTLSSNRFQSIKITNRDNIWCHTYDNKAFLFDTRMEVFIDFFSLLPEHIGGNGKLRSIYNLVDNRFGIQMWNDDCFLVNDSLLIEGDPEKAYQRCSLTEMRRLIRKEKQNRLYRIEKDGNIYVKDTLNGSSDFIYNISKHVRGHFVDRQGSIWMNTVNRGLDKLHFVENNYKIRDIGKGLESRAMMLDSGNRLWAASKDSVIHIYDFNGKPIGFLSDKGVIEKRFSSFNRTVYNLMEDKDGNIWISTKPDGLFILKNNGKLLHYRHNESDSMSISNDNVYTVFQDSRDNIWIGTYGGGINLARPTEDGGFEFVNSSNILKHYPVDKCMQVRHITESNGLLLIGTTQGLITSCVDSAGYDNICFNLHERRADDRMSLSNNDVMQVYTTNSGAVYIATSGGGLNQLIDYSADGENLKFRSFTTSQGLPSDLVLSLIEDVNGLLWIVTESALTRYNPTSHECETFGMSYFSHSFNFSEAIPVADSWGTLLFGSDKGIIEIDPIKLRKSDYNPNILFTGLRIQGDTSRIHIGEIRNLSLNPDQRNITIHYAALDYIDPQAIKYAYMLDGIDNGWNMVGKSRSATYINLPPGRYEFKVKSTNSDGVWRDNVKTLHLEVIPSFKETTLAYVLYAVVLLLIVILIVYIMFYIFRLRHRVAMEQQIADVKLRFFTDVSHELRTPLTLIAGPLSNIIEKEKLPENVSRQLEIVNRNTQRMLRLVNQILDLRKHQNNKLKLYAQEVDIVEYIKVIMSNFNQLAIQSEMNLRMESNSDRVSLWIDKDKFEKILFNLISNAFKYSGRNSDIVVGVRNEDTHVHITVTDNGEGISKDKISRLFDRFDNLDLKNKAGSSTGIGLSIVKEFVEMHGGSVSAESQQGIGAAFTVRLPKGAAHYSGNSLVEFILDDDDCIDMTKDDLVDEISLFGNDRVAVLLVEDNDELREFMTEILSESYRVLAAVNGAEGFEKAVKMHPDIIITDIMMPVMDGNEMVSRIKENNAICHIPIIVLTAKSSQEDKLQSVFTGVDDYITKPFNAKYLLARINSLIEQRKLLQQYYIGSVERKEFINIAPSVPNITPFDEEMIARLVEFVEQNIDNAELSVEQFSSCVSLGRTSFYKKLKSLVGMTPVDFIKEIRLKRAVQLIDSSEYSVSEIAYMTGFTDPKYFSKCFKKHTGVNPREYRERNKEVS